jgi:hypothetical protein
VKKLAYYSPTLNKGYPIRCNENLTNIKRYTIIYLTYRLIK